MLEALLGLQSSPNHGNEPSKQLLLFITGTIQITTVFHIKFISYQTMRMIFYKAIGLLHNHIIRNIFNHPKQNNTYLIIRSKIIFLIVILQKHSTIYFIYRECPISFYIL